MPSRTDVAMGTFVTIELVGAAPDESLDEIFDRAFGWFHYIEERCTRFNPASELMRLTSRVGEAVPVSQVLFEAVNFALAIAEESGGAFDPTVGGEMERRGFCREYVSGETIRTRLPSLGRQNEVRPNDGQPSYRDIVLDPQQRTIFLRRPLVLDLGAVAKGLAVDAAARELAGCKDFLVDAGGDIYAGGCNYEGKPWRIGIRHPREAREFIGCVNVSNMAVCTSGDYARQPQTDTSPAPISERHHLLDPRSNSSATGAASVTVIAPIAIMADALATAAFVIGPPQAIKFLERLGADGLIITPQLECYQTQGWPHAR
jgi:FAD:protein FMN transferase